MTKNREREKPDAGFRHVCAGRFGFSGGRGMRLARRSRPHLLLEFLFFALQIIPASKSRGGEGGGLTAPIASVHTTYLTFLSLARPPLSPGGGRLCMKEAYGKIQIMSFNTQMDHPTAAHIITVPPTTKKPPSKHLEEPTADLRFAAVM